MHKFTFFNEKLCFKLLVLSFCFIVSNAVYAQEPTWELAKTKYETADAFVIGINVMDHGADPTGTEDQTRLVQGLLDKLGSRTDNTGRGNGGVLYFPEGKYLFRGTITIPKGVTIRGEWEKPVKGQPIKGTILMAANPNAKGNDATKLPNGQAGTAYEAQSFIIMQPSSAVRDVNIWYPEQDANNIVPYPPAILFGQQGYWGNDYCLTSNITLVNAFDGIIFSRRSGGGAPNCYGIYGTPLRRGIEIDNIAEVGRIDNVDFSPDYWAGSGLPGSPSVNGKHKEYIAENGTAVVMRRNDWSFACKVKAEGYNIGYHMGLSYNTDQNGNYTSPNGHNYGMEFTNCKYGVYAEAVAGAGMMFYEYKFTDCDYGFFFTEKAGGVVQIQACEFNTKIASLYSPEANNTKILINQCTFNKGPVDIRGSLASIVSSNFNDKSKHIVLGSRARVAVTGNRFHGNDPDIKNVSMYECHIDHTAIEMDAIPHFPYKNQYDFNQKPAGNTYFLATANGVSTDADDNSDALQALLDQAGAAGGGLVFLPPGKYNFRKPIRIPTGVELKGSCDVPSVPTGPGTAMEIYAGKEDENGTPFITMERGSGIRGLVMDYPEQKVQLLTDPSFNNKQAYKYSYTIRGNADVYIVNVGLRASYHGIDLFTNKCDNHFVDYLAGHVFKTGIRVGGGSKGGRIYNSQFNQIAYGAGGETKFGAWPNSPNNNREQNPNYDAEFDAAYSFCWNHLDFIVLEDCEEQYMYNNFDFGSNRGFVLSQKNGKAASGLSLGQGIDQGMKAFYFEAVGEKGFSFINSQIVTTAPGNSYIEQTHRTNNRYIQVDENFRGKVTFFGADFWGQPQNISVEVLNGILEMQAGNFDNPGLRNFASVPKNGMFDLIGTNINSISSLLTENTNPQFFIQSSMLNSRNTDTESCGLWLNNLELTASVSSEAGAFLKPDGWIASSSVYNDDASKAIDRDPDSRWSSLSERQKPGQWFMIDMRKRNTFNGIYLDAGSNAYRPINITISISDDGINWKNIATANNADQVLFDTQNAQYIKVTQNSTGTSAWRIVEFYVIDSYLPNTSIEIPSLGNDVNVWFSDGRLNLLGTSGNSNVRIYNSAGQLLATPLVMNGSTEIHLKPGIYLLEIEDNGKVYRKKLLKN